MRYQYSYSRRIRKSHTEINIVANDATCGDGGVLLQEVVGKFGTIMTSVRLRENTKVAVLILGELGIEGLQQLPYV